MKQSKLTSIVTALMAISHNRVDYPKGATFEVDEKDIVFLNLAGCVRDPTADELKAYEERQTLATVTATQPEATDHAGLQPQPPSDIEPDAVEVVEAEAVEVVEAEPVVETVEAPQPEAIEPVQAVEPETVEPQPNKSAYNDWLKKDLNAELDKRGIEHDAAARNDDLEALLIADDEHQAQADA